MTNKEKFIDDWKKVMNELLEVGAERALKNDTEGSAACINAAREIRLAYMCKDGEQRVQNKIKGPKRNKRIREDPLPWNHELSDDIG